MVSFENPEDQEFFKALLCEPGDQLAAYEHLFDLRPLKTKRAEFNGRMKALKAAMIERFGEVCQLRLVPECDAAGGLAVDHVIPLSSNKLNKELRHLAADEGRKVVSQNFGSNDHRNLVLACKRCNGYKKHRFLSREELRRVLSVHRAV